MLASEGGRIATTGSQSVRIMNDIKLTQTVRIPSHQRGCAAHNLCSFSPPRDSCALLLWAACPLFNHTEAECVNYTSQPQITQPRPITTESFQPETAAPSSHLQFHLC